MNIFSKATIVPTLWLFSFLASFLILPLTDGVQIAIAITGLLGAVGAAFIRNSEENHLRYSALTFMICALWLISLLSVVVSEVPFIALTYFFFFSALPLSFLIFSQVGEKVGQVFSAVRWIILALGVSALIQFFAFPQLLKSGGSHLPFADNNTLAIFLAAGALLYIGEMLRYKDVSKYNILAAIILFAGIMTTGGVAVFWAFFLVLGGFIWLVKPQSYKPTGIFLLGTVILFCTMVKSDLSLYHFLNTGNTTISDFLDKTADENNQLSGSRLMIWNSTIELIKANPILGTGIGTFFIYYPEFRNMNDNSAGYMAHNDLLQIGAEMGVFAPLIAFLIISYLIFHTLKKIRKLETVQERLVLALPFSVFGLIIGHSLVNFNLYILPALILMGALLAQWNNQISTKSIAISLTRQMREIVTFLGVLAFLVPMWACTLSEFHTIRAIESLEKGNIAGFSDNLNMADSWSLGRNARPILQAAKFAAATENSDKALSLLDRAESINPRFTQIYIERARILFATDKQKSLENAEKALHLDKTSIDARMIIADILEYQGKKDEAYTILKEGMNGTMRSLTPDEYYQRLSILSLERGDLDTNKQVLSRLARLRMGR